MNKETPVIGIFDSGVGGFSVFSRLSSSVSVRLVYYGDSKNAPYGNKSNEEIVTLITQSIAFLKQKGVTHFVNACNSMSVLTTQELLNTMSINEDHYTDMILAFEKHATFSSVDRVLVIATEATVRSGSYKHVLEHVCEKVEQVALRSLAKDIEDNCSVDVFVSTIREIIAHAKRMQATHVVYGCTHYPLIHEHFVRVAHEEGWGGVFVDPAFYVAKEVASWNLQGNKEMIFYTSKETEVFKRYRDTFCDMVG